MAALGRWRERRVHAQLVALGLLGAESAPLAADDDARYYQVLATVLEELDESVGAADKLDAEQLDAESTRVLVASGHPSPTAPRARLHTLALHLGDLQCARASDTATSAPEGGDADADARLACALHRVQTALCWTVNKGDISLGGGVSCAVRALVPLAEEQGMRARGALLSPAALSISQRESVSALAEALAEEYRVRRALLLQRLAVTARSFAAAGVRGAAGSAPRAARAVAQVARAAPPPPAYALPHACLATRALLAPPRPREHTTRAARVRGVLMGAVPDRGGRVAAGAKAAATLMPAFQPRTGESDAPDARAERKSRNTRARKRASKGGGRKKAALIDDAL